MHKLYIGARLDEGRREIDPDSTIVFEFGNGAVVKLYMTERGEIRATADDGVLAVLPQSSNVVALKPHDVAAETAARRVQKAIERGEAIMVPDVRTIIEAALR